MREMGSVVVNRCRTSSYTRIQHNCQGLDPHSAPTFPQERHLPTVPPPWNSASPSCLFLSLSIKLHWGWSILRSVCVYVLILDWAKLPVVVVVAHSMIPTYLSLLAWRLDEVSASWHISLCLPRGLTQRPKCSL